MIPRLGALLLAACAAPVAPPPRAPAARPDDAAVLAAWLPERADRCVIARPGRVPARRRALLLRQSWADPNVWEDDLAVTAYARAEATLPGNARASRAYFRFGGTPSEARAHGESLPVRWDGARCRGVACRRPSARWLDERTVEVSHRAWPDVVQGFDTRECRRLLHARADATEVAVRVDPMRGAPTAVWAERTLVADRRGLEMRTELLFEHALEAERALEAVEASGAVLDSLQPMDHRERVVRRFGDRVQVHERHSWTELELAREDERLEIAASALLRQRSVPLPVAEVDVESLAVVRHQLRLRAAVLERARGPARREVAAALAALLSRAWAANPSEAWIAARLARLWLSETGQVDDARALAEAVLGAGVAADLEAWRVLRREALVGAGPSALAQAWVADGVADGATEARRGAEDVARLSAEGVGYEWAEGAWRIGRELSAGEPTVASQGTLSRRGILGALVALGRATGPAPGVTVQVAVVTTAEHPPQAIGRSGPELVVTRGRGGGSVLVGALGSTDLLEVRRLAGLIDALVGPGPASFVVWLRDPGSSAGVRLRVEGVMRADGLAIRRVSRALGALDVAQADRLLARPLHDLSASLFPPPELVVRAESLEDATALEREVLEPAPGACASAGPLLRCRAPGRPEVLTDVILGLARARFSGLLQPAP